MKILYVCVRSFGCMYVYVRMINVRTALDLDGDGAVHSGDLVPLLPDVSLEKLNEIISSLDAGRKGYIT